MAKVAVITGASGGLGASLAQVLEKNGYTVCGLSRTNPGGLDNFFYCDVTKEESVEAAFEGVKKSFGEADLVIINAGVGIAGETACMPSELAEKAFGVNFFGALYCAKAAAKCLKKGGRLVGISSAAAFFALPYRSLYAATKAALNLMLWGLSMEERDIEVTSICPGEIDTPFTQNRLWHIDEASPHAAKLKKIAEKFEESRKRRMDSEKVAGKIFRICQKKRLSPLYIIGAKYRFFYFLQKILPQRAMMALAAKKYGGGNE